MTAKVYFSWMLACFVAAFLILPTSKSVNNFYYVLMAIPGLFLLLKNYKLLKPNNLTEWLFYIFSAYVAIYSFFEYPKVVIHCLYVLVFLFVTSRFVDLTTLESKLLAKLLFWGLLLYVAAGAIVYYVIGDTPFGVPVNPGLSRLDNPIHTSMFIACTLFVVTPHWFNNKSYWEGVLGVILAFLAIAVIFQSRSGIVGMAVWSLFALTYLLKKFGFKGGLVLVLGAISLVVVSIAVFDLAGQSSQLIDRADSHRFAIWSGYIKALNDCGMLIGCGFPEIISQHLVWEQSSDNIFHPHNIYVEMGFHYGVVSLFIFGTMMMSALYLAWGQKSWWGAYLLTGLVVLNFDGSRVMDSPNEVWLMIWLPLSLILARSWQDRNISID